VLEHYSTKAQTKGGIAPHIFNLGTGWRLVASLSRTNLIVEWTGGWVSPTANPNAETGHCGHEEKEAAEELKDTAVSESRSRNPCFPEA